ncbi:MAG: tRNA (guanosine(37)-N1)-methyltransferase TrmD [Lachnospiraceae bacterium]|nr:tRNA (guanosine(37)-N1)-methyltransferase TrmD [Lachnospiraceae bacterium]
MNFHIMTLFPDMVMNTLDTSILARAINNGLIACEAVNIRDYTLRKNNRVDDYTYGGGAGMLMQAQPVYDCWKSIQDRLPKKSRVVFLTPQGRVFNQKIAEDLSKEDDLILLCGHYEGIDERVLDEIVTDNISIGDYVLTGGELPAIILVDAISRFVPGVLGNESSASTDSFQDGLLEYPQYSRPEVWHDKRVPEILMSGDHARVDAWRLEQSIERTKERRPDLYKSFLAK